MDKEKKAQAIIAFLKNNPGQFYSANKIKQGFRFSARG